MSGDILRAARLDSKAYVTQGGFEEDITLKTPNGLITVQTTGFASKHHISFDSDGTTVNAKNAHICVDEAALVALNYPVRVNEEVALRNHRVSYPDNSGVVKHYIVKENFPDETLGLIVCVLGDFEE